MDCARLAAKEKTFDRRRFLKIGLAAASAGTLTSCARVNGPRWRFFTAEEAKTVEAISEQLIPADRDPGASQAGVVHYIDLQLAQHLKRHQRAYRQGLAAVDQTSRARFGRVFTGLRSAQQIAVLTEIEKQPFFDLILSHTMQGFYGDPRHGGNRNAVSWRMLGLPYPPVRGRMSYQPRS